MYVYIFVCVCTFYTPGMNQCIHVMYIYIYVYIYAYECVCVCTFYTPGICGVPTISMPLQIIGLFCRIQSLL